jgi:hypothetical protein
MDAKITTLRVLMAVALVAVRLVARLFVELGLVRVLPRLAEQLVVVLQ